jgi:hypothetical protein
VIVSVEALWRDFATDPAVKRAAVDWLEEIATWAREGQARGIILAGAAAVVADLCGWRGELAEARAAARERYVGAHRNGDART